MSKKLTENTNLTDAARDMVRGDTVAVDLEHFRARDQFVVGFRPAESAALQRFNEFAQRENENLMANIPKRRTR